MGVPQYFFWLIKQHGADILERKMTGSDSGLGGGDGDNRVDYFFLDFNCAIHPAVKKEGLETMVQLYEAVGEYLEILIGEAKARRLIYIAIDGVAPFAKIKQQRFRRFKTVYDKVEKDKIERKYKKTESKPLFDFNMISPGTEFMNGLAEYLRGFIACRRESWGGAKVILDDANNPGEGEHKIMEYIRKNEDIKNNIVIYGLDSDLIFLSLLNYRKNMKLLREVQFFGGNEEGNGKDKEEIKFNYLDIGKFREIIVNYTFEEKLLDHNRLILDYVALSFILGNDFLHHLPSLHIKDGGFDRVMKCYKMVKNGYRSGGVGGGVGGGGGGGGGGGVRGGVRGGSLYIVRDDGLNFNYDFLVELFRYIAEAEVEDFYMYRKNSEKRQREFGRSFKYGQAGEYERALMDWEYIEDKIDDELLLGDDGWEERYYSHYLGEYNELLIEKMVQDYLTGLVWILRYYRCGNHHWSWCYNFRNAPAAKTIYLFLKKYPDFLSGVQFAVDEPVSTKEQLLMILPPQSSALLPNDVNKLMTALESPLIGYYPVKFKIDMQMHRYRWECYPILPIVDLEFVKKVVRDLLIDGEMDKNGGVERVE